MSKRKVLIIVPHEDDEINIAGGTILKLKDKAEIKIVYVTNGDLVFNAKDRFKEAIASLKVLGVNRDSIIFLGYSDQSYDKQNHMYNTEGLWISEKGYSKTYGIKEIDEWCYQKHGIHNEFKKGNVINDLKEIILDYMPEEIICVDLDFHPDHIMTSLCFEKAMGEILKEKKNQYNPRVLKTFAYENSYLGKDDFTSINDYGMIFDIDDKGNLKNNPYYNIKNAINITVPKETYTKNLLKNRMWRAIKKHKTQILVRHASRIINSNYMYWERNTNNLLNNAKIEVSSSKAEYLNDFLLCDTGNVLNGNKNKIKYDKGIWIPEVNDSKKEIEITFEDEQYVKILKLYFGLINSNFIKNITIKCDNDEKEYRLSNNLVQKIIIDRKVKKIIIKILDNVYSNGFSEIELLDSEYEKKEKFKVIIDDCWTSNYIVNKKKSCKIVAYPSYANYSIDITNLKNGKYENGILELTKRSRGYIRFNYNNEFDDIHINSKKVSNFFWSKIYIAAEKKEELCEKICRKVHYLKNKYLK